jgi:hypothetical protein
MNPNEAERSRNRIPFVTAADNKEKSNGPDEDLEPSLERK